MDRLSNALGWTRRRLAPMTESFSASDRIAEVRHVRRGRGWAARPCPPARGSGAAPAPARSGGSPRTAASSPSRARCGPRRRCSRPARRAACGSRPRRPRCESSMPTPTTSPGSVVRARHLEEELLLLGGVERVGAGQPEERLEQAQANRPVVLRGGHEDALARARPAGRGTSSSTGRRRRRARRSRPGARAGARPGPASPGRAPRSTGAPRRRCARRSGPSSSARRTLPACGAAPPGSGARAGPPTVVSPGAYLFSQVR